MKCPTCSEQFKRPYDLKVHQREQHGDPTMYSCDQCSYKAKRPSDLKSHKRRHVQQAPRRVDMPATSPLNPDNLVYPAILQNAMGDRLRKYRVWGTKVDPQTFLNSLTPQISEYVNSRLQEVTGLKLQLMMSIQFFKPTEPGKKAQPGGFYSYQLPIFRGTEYDVTELYPKILQVIDNFTKLGSGWAIETINFVDVTLVKYQPLRGSTFAEIPRKLKVKKAIVNVKNTDEKCFLWSILAALHPLEGNHGHPNRVSNYTAFENELNFDGIEFPVQTRDVKKFEKLNNLAISVYIYHEHEIHPLRISDERDFHHIHLLLHDGHYSLIKNLNRLLYDQTKHKERKFFCPRCLFPKTTQAILDEHLELCSTEEPTKVKMPTDTTLKFENFHRMLRQPLVVYADFECLTEPMENKKGASTQYQHHKPCGYGLVESLGCCGEPEFKEPTVYRGPKTVERFLIDIVGIANEYQNKIMDPMPMPDDADTSSGTCHICQKEIEDDGVRDHCHICGRYRGVAHNRCNLKYRLNRDIVVVFHNLRRYDGHLIMQEIGQISKLMGFEIEVVAKAIEDYLSFNLKHKRDPKEKGGPVDHSYKIRFIDSVQFLNNSLEGLVSNLTDDKFKALGQFFSGDELALLKRKGVYPYDYMDADERFREKQLPSIDKFYSKLNDHGIEQESYDHAQNVWRTFKIRNMGEYHDLYLKTDVLLLADVFEGFRQFALDKYGLDPAHYITTPSLAWEACLKMTGVELQLFDDPDMYLFCERGIRGGISQISHRHAKANNPLVPGYDPNLPTTFLPYWDKNNLYGYAMSQKLPVDGFKWMTHDEMVDTNFDDVDGDVGYILEVDLEYPVELHDSHSDYPLAPEPMQIKEVSPYCTAMKESLNLQVPPCTKLTLNLHDKKNYILHFKNLKLYRELGMKVTKIHRVLSFNQRAWMAQYINFNTAMRALATNSFDKDLLKLMNNSVFGKTMENVRKYRCIELVNDEYRFEKLAANPRFKNSCRFNDSLVGVSLLKASCQLRKPIFIGLVVLDLSKEHMYEYHYKYVVPKYGSKAKLLFTDTDSFCYCIETDDIYKDMLDDADGFDFSDYPYNHPNHSNANKKVIGKMKDETNGLPIWEFCGLRPKMYSMEGEGFEKKRAKGVKKGVVKEKIRHQDFLNVLFDEKPKKHSMNLIVNRLHEVFSETLVKTSLSPYDDKRWLLNRIESRAHGHYLNQVIDMEID